jgi:hypothetical protein
MSLSTISSFNIYRTGSGEVIHSIKISRVGRLLKKRLKKRSSTLEVRVGIRINPITTQYLIAYNGITTPIDYWLIAKWRLHP